LKRGGLLGLFPAGEVSSWRFDEGRVADKDWHPQLGRLALATGSDILPLYFEGSNSAFFHLFGLLSPRLRTLLLPRSLLDPSTEFLRFRAGRLVSHEEIQKLGSASRISIALRSRTYALQPN
jgi:putative hemolysin